MSAVNKLRLEVRRITNDQERFYVEEGELSTVGELFVGFSSLENVVNIMDTSIARLRHAGEDEQGESWNII